MIKQFRQVLFIFLLFVAATGIILLGINLGKNTAPEDSGAIYGGSSESGYPYAGYMIAAKSSSEISICSVVYLSPNTALSAAHCIHSGAETFVGKDDFKLTSGGNFTPSSIIVKPGWDGNDSVDDLSVIKLRNSSAIDLNEFAEVAVPQEGCNYIVVGYGSTETDLEMMNPDRPRKSARLCLDRMERDLLYFNGQDGGLCFGDSGSPVFERGTNKLVAIISAIRSQADSGGTPCHVGNQAIAVRLDKNIDFIQTVDASISSYESKFAKCGQDCGDLSCAEGLTCDTRGTCKVASQSSCTADLGERCNDAIGLSCLDGAECILNYCRTVDFIGSNLGIDTSILFDFSNNTTLLIWGFGAATFLMLIVLIVAWTRRK